MKYKRILLKLSGEIFGGGEEKRGISFLATEKIAKDIIKIKQKYKGDLAIVVGGGNIFRGREAVKLDRVAADNIGMLATIINGLILKETLINMNVSAEVLTSSLGREVFSKETALSYFKNGKTLILTEGTGNPFFSSDTAAALRACELGCDLILKATNVDGIYDKDPVKHSDAKLYKEISFKEALYKNLKIMDGTAFSLCENNKIPIVVFNVKKINKVIDFLGGKLKLGTLVE